MFVLEVAAELLLGVPPGAVARRNPGLADQALGPPVVVAVLEDVHADVHSHTLAHELIKRLVVRQMLPLR